MSKLISILLVVFAAGVANASPSATCELKYEVGSVNFIAGLGGGKATLTCGQDSTDLSIGILNLPGVNLGVLHERGTIKLYGPNMDTNQWLAVIVRAQAMIANSTEATDNAYSAGAMVSTAPGVQVFWNVSEVYGPGVSLSFSVWALSSLPANQNGDDQGGNTDDRGR